MRQQDHLRSGCNFNTDGLIIRQRSLVDFSIVNNGQLANHIIVRQDKEDSMAQPRSSSAADMRRSFGYREIGDGEKQPLVNDVFNRVARRYDIMNDLMSGGLHRLWKDALVARLAPPRHPKSRWQALDIAGGTGDIAQRIIRMTHGNVHVTVFDINSEMLSVGRDRAEKSGISGALDFVEGNAEQLPFATQSFDACTIAFGIRNVPDIATALSETYRVLRFGGQFLCLEFSAVNMPYLEQIYDQWSMNAIPAIGRIVTGEPDPYRYLVESVRRFPDQNRFCEIIRSAGFSRVGFRNFSGGIAALHWGWKL
jgi:demethylmenaquinone methyltransferase / 2-methoxy-6-polyprenyl-1,4-benzoquinol methylase